MLDYSAFNIDTKNTSTVTQSLIKDTLDGHAYISRFKTIERVLNHQFFDEYNPKVCELVFKYTILDSFINNNVELMDVVKQAIKKAHVFLDKHPELRTKDHESTETPTQSRVRKRVEVAEEIFHELFDPETQPGSIERKRNSSLIIARYQEEFDMNISQARSQIYQIRKKLNIK